MNGVWIAAGSIVAATMLGSAVGNVLTGVSRRVYLVMLSLAAGIMLCAAVQGLLLPALEVCRTIWVCVGMGSGAAFLFGMNTAAAKILQVERSSRQLHGLMYVLAIAIHHLPEGIAAGVSFGLGGTAETVSVCTAIALQNIPEVMVIMPVMADYGRGKALFAAAVSAAVEIAGLVLGFFAVQFAVRTLPILLAFAAGAMLYVIFENMLPDSYESGGHTAAVSLMTGYCGMLLLSELMETLL